MKIGRYLVVGIERGKLSESSCLVQNYMTMSEVDTIYPGKLKYVHEYLLFRLKIDCNIGFKLLYHEFKISHIDFIGILDVYGGFNKKYLSTS